MFTLSCLNEIKDWTQSERHCVPEIFIKISMLDEENVRKQSRDMSPEPGGHTAHSIRSSGSQHGGVKIFE